MREAREERGEEGEERRRGERKIGRKGESEEGRDGERESGRKGGREKGKEGGVRRREELIHGNSFSLDSSAFLMHAWNLISTGTPPPINLNIHRVVMMHNNSIHGNPSAEDHDIPLSRPVENSNK